MRAGRLRERITLQSFTASQGATGQPVKTWAALATRPTVWASILPAASGERFISGGEQVQAEITHTVRIRYRSDVTVQMRVVWGSRTLNIESVVDPDGKTAELVLMCKEVTT